MTDTHSAGAQRQRLMEALRRGPVSTLDARRELDVLHPAARVQELREAGYSIRTYWSTEETQPGRTHRVGRYVLLTGGNTNGGP